jgi:hypothetical protein
MPAGAVVSFADFSDLLNKQAVALTLSRLAKDKVIVRLARGRYFKPKYTKFGFLGPSEEATLKAMTRPSHYISGISAMNRLGLTTQVPAEITIGGASYDRTVRVGKLRLRFKRTPLTSTPENRDVLPMMDALKDIKKIPDTEVPQAILLLKRQIAGLPLERKTALVRQALAYRPATRALLGAILEDVGSNKLSRTLRDTLNPLSSYKVGIQAALRNAKSWRIT